MPEGPSDIAAAGGPDERLAGVVVVHSPRGGSSGHSHDAATQSFLAERIAGLKGYAFAGPFEHSRRHSCPVYFVPGDTLLSPQAERELGIRSEQDLFGAVAPYPFMATKAITHPAVGPDACTPHGWSRQFGELVKDAVLPGFSAFTPDDARRAGLRLLSSGPVRIKPVRESGGRGQIVANEAAALDAALASMDPGELARFGLVLEENLTDVRTYSVGQVRIGELHASYVGTQHLTRNNSGQTVYGGSALLVARGGWDALLARDLASPARRAIAQARAYDAAAEACFPGFFASRRNYDIAEGGNAAGARRMGVLEQSWRIGGASPAEIAALELFRADPDCRTVRAACFESYGEAECLPPDCVAYYSGIDSEAGPITKFLRVARDDDQQ